jgi:peptide/nickel transport system substrate-binding protein
MFKRFPRLLTVAIAILMSMAIGSCQQIDPPSLASTKNQLVYGVLSDPNSFNAALNNTSPSIFGLVSEGLIGEDGKGNLEPNLAESWQVSADKKSIIVTLKPNLKWSDGQPLTVDDVLFTYNEVYLNKEVPNEVSDSLLVGKDRKFPTVKQLDQRRIEFSTHEPFVPLLRNLGNTILPAHKLRASVREKVPADNPKDKPKAKFLSMWGIQTPPKDLVYSGMYKLDTYAPGERLIFKKNPYYWRKDKQGNQQPYVDRIVWQIVESLDTSLVQFRSGNLDSFGVSPEYFSLLKPEEKKSNFTIYNGGPASGTTFISFNLNQGSRNGKSLIDPVKAKWFNNVKFRQAIAYGIDRQRMINNIYRGIGAPQDSPLSVPSPYYFSRKEGLKVYDYNLKEAKRLLESAGFKRNSENKLVDSDDNPVRFTLLTNAGNKTREAMGTQIKQDLEELGITVDFTPISFDLLVDKIDTTLDWECLLIGFTGGAEPHDGANFWSVDGRSHLFNQKPSDGQTALEGRVVSDWEQQIDDLYIKGAQEFDETKRRQIYIETQKITQEQLPCIYLINPLSLSAIRNRIDGIDYSPLSGAFWNLYELKIKN